MDIIKEKYHVIERIVQCKIKQGVFHDHINHVCHKGFCDPCNEQMLSNRGLLQGGIDVYARDLYVCNYQVIHYCSKDTCTAVDNGVCRISGACYGTTGTSTYDKNDYRTWRAKTDNEPFKGSSADFIYKAEPKEHIEQKQKIKDEIVRPRKRRRQKPILKSIQEIVEKLLFGAERIKINKSIKNTVKEHCNVEITNYVKTCMDNHMAINTMHIYKITLQVSSRTLIILPYDLNIIERYTSLITHICRNILKINPNINIELTSLTLALLYKMRIGYMYENEEILAIDPFLIDILPEISQLPFFGYEKTRITIGERIIEYAFNYAKEKRIAPSEFKYDQVFEHEQVDMRPANFRLKREK